MKQQYCKCGEKILKGLYCRDCTHEKNLKYGRNYNKKRKRETTIKI